MSKMSKAIAVLGVVAGLGVAALPLSSYAVSSKPATTTAQAIVSDSIAISVDKNMVEMGTVVANAEDPAEGSATITVQSNKGYRISIEDTETNTALMPTAEGGTADGIPADVPAQGKNAWGFKASSESSNVNATASANYRALLAKGGGTTLATGTGASAPAGDEITLTFGVTVNTEILPGTYQNEVVLTATTNS